MRMLDRPVPQALPDVAARVGAIVEAPAFFGNFSGRRTLSAAGPGRRRPPHAGRRRPRAGRAARAGRRPGQVLLPRHAPAPRRRVGPAQGARTADPRRAGQRSGPGRHPRDARPAAGAGLRRYDGDHLQPHPGRDRADLRFGDDHLAGQTGRRRTRSPTCWRRTRPAASTACGSTITAGGRRSSPSRPAGHGRGRPLRRRRPRPTRAGSPGRWPRTTSGCPSSPRSPTSKTRSYG